MPLRRFKFYSMVHFLDTELLVRSFFFFFLPNDPHCLQLKSRYKMLFILKTLHTLPRKVYLSQFAFHEHFYICICQRVIYEQLTIHKINFYKPNNIRNAPQGLALREAQVQSFNEDTSVIKGCKYS